MIIVIEGPDGAGKTTLAHEFETRGFRYVHNGPPKPGENVFETYTDQILSFGLQDMVFDRLHLGEWVYGGTMRGRSLLSIEQIHLLNRLIYSRGAKTLLCLPRFETILANWETRREKEYVKDATQLERIYGLYESFVEEYQAQGLNHQVVDYENLDIPNFDRLFDRVPHLNEGVIGNPRARYLFVGEQAGGTRDLAFYSNQRCSHFLNEALWEAGYTEGELAFTNAYDKDGKPRKIATLTGAIQPDPSMKGIIYNGYRTFDGPQTIITLGALAHRQCELQDVEHHQALHPQYVKRFKSRQRWRYVELLRTFREGA